MLREPVLGAGATPFGVRKQLQRLLLTPPNGIDLRLGSDELCLGESRALLEQVDSRS